MKTPKFIFRDKELAVSRHEIKSYDDERIRCFLMAPKSLVEKTPCLIYILADVIDRNNLGGVDILKWLLLQPNAQLILGNHEQMLLSNRWVFQEISDESIDNIEGNNIELLKLWESNGAECTIKALSKESAEMRRDILEYLDECPLIESLIVNNRKYVLVHGGLGNFSLTKKISDYTTKELLWSRPYMDTEYNPEKYTVVFGHTPTCLYSREFKNRMIKTDSWWNIDTGAAMDNGRPMLLCLDKSVAYYIEEDGSVTEERV